MKFKVGDKVEFVEFSPKEDMDWLQVENDRGLTIGAIVEIIGTGNMARNENVYQVRVLHNQAELGLFEHQLTYPRVKYTRLAARMYPEGRKEGEWWYLK